MFFFCLKSGNGVKDVDLWKKWVQKRANPSAGIGRFK